MASAVWDPRVKRFRDPANGRFVKAGARLAEISKASPRTKPPKFAKAAKNLHAVAAPESPPRGRLLGLDRPRLLKLARKRGVALRRGAPIDEIDRMIFSDIKEKEAARRAAANAAFNAQFARKKTKTPPVFRQPRRPVGPATEAGARRFHRDTGGMTNLAAAVEGGQIKEERRLAGGAVGDTRLRTYADGTQVVWKRGGDYGAAQESDAEQLASLIARALGLKAPRVYRRERDAVSMDFVDQARTAFEDRRIGFGGPPPEFLDSDEGRMMGLLDLLIDNQDRHAGNYMVTEDGHMVPIDHGYAFRAGHINKPGSGRKITTVKSPFAPHYKGRRRLHEVGDQPWAENDLTPQDVAAIRRRLAALRPDFEHIDRGRWHEFMMERLDEIGKHARGTRSRLLPSLVG